MVPSLGSLKGHYPLVWMKYFSNSFFFQHQYIVICVASVHFQHFSEIGLWIQMFLGGKQLSLAVVHRQLGTGVIGVSYINTLFQMALTSQFFFIFQ